MDTIPQLETDFGQAAIRCRRETLILSRTLHSQLLAGTSPITLWQPEEWKFGGQHNCYNFALNVKTGFPAAPGNFYGTPLTASILQHSLSKFHESVHAAVIKDGLTYLGSSFHDAASLHLNPVALFIRPHPYVDFHWAALRQNAQELFWAHIPGMGSAAQRTRPYETIFDLAHNRGYDYFGGYYGVPAHKEFVSRYQPPASFL